MRVQEERSSAKKAASTRGFQGMSSASTAGEGRNHFLRPSVRPWLVSNQSVSSFVMLVGEERGVSRVVGCMDDIARSNSASWGLRPRIYSR